MLSALAAPLLFLTAFSTSGIQRSERGFDWPGTGSAFLSAHESVNPDQSFEGFLNSDLFAHADLGAFVLYIPAAELQIQDQAELFQEFALIVVDLQSTWHDWRATDIGSEKPQQEWASMRKWVAGWKPKKMTKLEGGANAFNEQIKGWDKLAELQQRLALKAQSNPAMEKYVGKRNRIVFAPSRQDFLETLAVAGLLEPEHQKTLWDTANMTRTAAWVGWTEVLCFEESGFPFDMGQPFLSQSMNRLEANARTQFIADRMSLQLLRKEFYPNGTHFFELSLGTNLVIEALGYNNSKAGDWNVSYKTAGGSTQAYERFVPGGNSAGGVLPARRAVSGGTTGSAVEISRYRENKGEKFFQASLKLSQKEGAKLGKRDKKNPLAKNKLAHFMLHSFESGADTFISAPFLGPLAENKPLPENEFIDDYEDFFRAYRSGFFHWLINNSAKDSEQSKELFSALIRNQSERKLDTKFIKVIESVYGVPLSALDDKEDSLEWRYLAWIKKSK